MLQKKVYAKDTMRRQQEGHDNKSVSKESLFPFLLFLVKETESTGLPPSMSISMSRRKDTKGNEYKKRKPSIDLEGKCHDDDHH
jgi:hypothetical protein